MLLISRRCVGIALALGMLGAAALVGSAGANKPTISGPTKFPGAPLLNGFACPSTSQCTGVGGNQELTFNPTAPSTSTVFAIDAGAGAATGVACPLVSQCTAVSSVGSEVTFDPASPGTPVAVTIASGADLSSVACPSASQCTAVGDDGPEVQGVTFNPAAPGTPTPVTFFGASGDDMASVACPSISECIAVDQSSDPEDFVPGTVTFDPTSLGPPSQTEIDSDSGRQSPEAPAGD